jgi:hypothetical protein
MAVAGIRLDINTAELTNLRQSIQRFFPNKQTAEILAPIIRKAIKPTVNYLRYITPVGPTGNLKRAVSSKVVTYKQDGVAVGIVGYTRAGSGASSSAAGGSVRAGKDRAFHQGLVEFGTKERKITQAKRRVYARKSPTKPFARRRNGQWELVMGKGVLHTVEERTPTYIASSFNKLGPFSIAKSVGGDGRVQTDPAYPKAFFRKSKTPIIIPEMPIGGATGMPPLKTAWEQTQSIVADSLRRDLALTLEQAWAALRYRDSGSASGTDTL